MAIKTEGLSRGNRSSSSNCVNLIFGSKLKSLLLSCLGAKLFNAISPVGKFKSQAFYSIEDGDSWKIGISRQQIGCIFYC